MSKSISPTRKQMQSQWHTDKSNCGLLSGQQQFGTSVISPKFHIKDSRKKFETATQDTAITTQDSLSTVILKKKKAANTHTHTKNQNKTTQPLLNSDNSVTGSALPVCKNAHSTHNIYTSKLIVYSNFYKQFIIAQVLFYNLNKGKLH